MAENGAGGIPRKAFMEILPQFKPRPMSGSAKLVPKPNQCGSIRLYGGNPMTRVTRYATSSG